jgi:hypothetical protein
MDDVFDASTLSGPNPPDLSSYGHRLLAEGDSWFTVSTLNPLATDNLLRHVALSQSTVAINCAYPGDTLRQIVEMAKDKTFARLVSHMTLGRAWAAVLMSAGGNDLIDAVSVPPSDAAGNPIPLQSRLLRSLLEVGSGATAAQYLSDAGWKTFEGYMTTNLQRLVSIRDSTPLNRHRPIFLHTYGVPTARPAGVASKPTGWLHPSLLMLGIPPALRQPVTAMLFEQFRQLMVSFDQGSGSARAQSHVHVYDSATKVPLVAANAASPGPSGDWINEIHLTTAGYRKMGAGFGQWMDTVLAHYPWH